MSQLAAVVSDANAHRIFKRNPHVRFRNVDGEAVVIHQETAEVLVLSAVGLRILELADGARSVLAWADVLADEVDAPVETLVADFAAFATELQAAGVLVCVRASATDTLPPREAGDAPP